MASFGNRHEPNASILACTSNLIFIVIPFANSYSVGIAGTAGAASAVPLSGWPTLLYHLYLFEIKQLIDNSLIFYCTLCRQVVSINSRHNTFVSLDHIGITECGCRTTFDLRITFRIDLPRLQCFTRCD